MSESAKQYDLTKLYVSIDHPEDKGFVVSSPRLSSFKEFHDAGDDISKIAILAGDIDSPFTLIKDRFQMITAIFDFLHISNKKLLEQIIDYKSKRYVDAWTKYLFILNETLYTDWLLAKKDYEFFLKESNKERETITGVKDIDKLNKLRATIKQLGQEVREIEAKLFPDSQAAREANMAENKKISQYAEQYAEEGSFI
jgi:hypothetical protein